MLCKRIMCWSKPFPRPHRRSASSAPFDPGSCAAVAGTLAPPLLLGDACWKHTVLENEEIRCSHDGLRSCPWRAAWQG